MQPLVDAANATTKMIATLQKKRAELTKVIWPSRQQLISESLAVIAMVTLSATTIYLVNNLFSWAAAKVFV